MVAAAETPATQLVKRSRPKQEAFLIAKFTIYAKEQIGAKQRASAMEKVPTVQREWAEFKHLKGTTDSLTEAGGCMAAAN